MERIIFKIDKFLKDNNLRPIKIVVLRDGTVCKFYKNGNIRAKDWFHINDKNK